MSNNYTNQSRMNPNSFPNWFAPLESRLNFQIPKTHWMPLCDERIEWLMSDDYREDEVRSFGDEILSAIHYSHLRFPVFIKTDTFSDKFTFKNCVIREGSSALEVGRKVLNMVYMGLCNGRDTCGLVLREFIDADNHLETIYNGLPLHTEFRVFYDFIRHEVVDVFPYWDAREMLGERMERYYKADPLNLNDKRNYLRAQERLERDFAAHKDELVQRVTESLKDAFMLPGGPALLNGAVYAVWSLDFLLDTNGELWFIDAAQGPESAFWTRLPKEKQCLDKIPADTAEEYLRHAAEKGAYVRTCPVCGGSEFIAHRRYYYDVLVDSRGNWLEDLEMYEAENEYGPYACAGCGHEVKELSELDFK